MTNPVFFDFWSSFILTFSMIDLRPIFSIGKKNSLKTPRTSQERLSRERKSSWLSLLQMQTYIKNFLYKTGLLRECYHNVIYSIASRWSSGTPPVISFGVCKNGFAPLNQSENCFIKQAGRPSYYSVTKPYEEREHISFPRTTGR